MPYHLEHQRLAGSKGAVSTTMREHSIIRSLMSRPGHFVALSDLISMVWPNPADEPEGVESEIRTYIRRIRIKMMEVGCEDKLETRWGLGYRWCTAKSQEVMCLSPEEVALVKKFRERRVS